MEQEDAQVLAQLYRRKAKLSIELERVNVAIQAFEEIDENSLEELDVAPYMIEANKDEMAIATLMYNPKWTIEKKIIYVLSKINKGTVKQIVEYLIQIDRDEKDPQQLFENVTFKASRMYKAGKIDAEKEGKRNIYKTKKTV